MGAPESIDDVRNGIAIAPTYHRAYDNGLIFLDEDYIMRINPAKEQELLSLNLTSGIKQFKSFLGKILLPHDRRQWPNVRLIKKANDYRMISS